MTVPWAISSIFTVTVPAAAMGVFGMNTSCHPLAGETLVERSGVSLALNRVTAMVVLAGTTA